MLTQEQIQTISGGTVVDSNGDKIGKAGQVYLDDVTGEPDWVTVNTGLFGTSESFVPLQGATADGKTLRVAYTKAQVKDAPRVDADGHLSEQEEGELYRHYGLSSGVDTTTAGTTNDAGADVDTGDDAMTVSEERLHVGTERREAGRARLRKYIVTEQETVTVPVTREEVRLEREPITDANRDDALAGPDLTESEHEVVLTEERPVVAKETVPVERVRLAKDTVTDQTQVTEEVRHEEVDTEGTDGGAGRK
ncbi:YsnF/AvaK domain-containing protein [Cellulomonas endometrii]|uniref:YsnF/AvaK domain-containing protein n=1 Tax=Cellulomonas endometrii TaxID=3036301 RepID=UPI0024AD274F|nr:YsnF/AvaK domain-containing protein [Cellulomonas endometrii]